MRNKISKIEVAREHGCTILGMKLEDDFISFEKLAGGDLKLGELTAILFTDKDVSKRICSYIKNPKREHSFNIHTVVSESGNIEMALRLSVGKIVPHYQVKARLKVFSARLIDINTIQNMYIGDLLEFIFEAYGVMYKNYNAAGTVAYYLSLSRCEISDERRRTGIRYIKIPKSKENKKMITADDVVNRITGLTLDKEKLTRVENRLTNVD